MEHTSSAPRIMLADIEANIVSEHYFTAADGAEKHCPDASDPESLKPLEPLKLLTFCVLVLRNSFTVVGQSACASPENFDPETGRRMARENAIAEVWPLMGYELKTLLSKA